MKRLVLTLGLMLVAGLSWADHEVSVAKDQGTYIETSVVTTSSFTGTALLSANSKRMGAVFQVVGGVAVYIGSTSAAMQTNHSNITLGLPIYSTSAFKLDGKFTGDMYGTSEAGQGSGKVRVLELLNR